MAPPSPAQPNSASSSLTEQPNFSDCHCCGCRTNHTNPKYRLQPLDSVWRIVLLCRKCRNSVRSGQTCPYCFKPTGNSGEFVKCSVCKSRIHVGCVKDYGCCTPWCYLGVGLGEFRTCMDCWVPAFLKNSVRVCVRSESKGGVKDCLDKVVKNGKSKAKDQELRKAMVAKEVGGGQNVENSNSRNAVEISHSTPRISKNEFSLNPCDLRVWKIMNWSGISYKRSGLRRCGKGKKMYSSSVENGVTEWTGEIGSSSDVNGFKLGLLTYKRDKKRKVLKIDGASLTVSESRSIESEEKFELHSDYARTSCSTDVSGSLLCVDANESGSRIDVNADQTSSCIHVDRFGENLATYKRTRFRRKGQVNGTVYVYGVENNMTRFMVNGDDEEILPKGSCNAEQDRYYLKYHKRVATTKPYLSRVHSNSVRCENQSSEPSLSNSETASSVKCDGELRLPNESSNAGLDRYSFKYVKRMKGSKCVNC